MLSSKVAKPSARLRWRVFELRFFQLTHSKRTSQTTIEQKRFTMKTIEMPESINFNRRRFLGTAALSIAAAKFATIGSADAQTSKKTLAEAAGGGEISIVLSDGRTFAATVVGSDPATDLAVLTITSPPAGLTAASFGDSAAAEVGEPVMALGNPLGLSDTVTTGIISAVNRPVTTSASQEQNPFGGASGESVVTNAIQTDAAINPGNSGGALVNARGQVIGITSSIASLGSAGTGGQSGSIGLGFAIPANTAKDIAAQLLASGSVQHAYLGVTLSEGTVTVAGAQRQAAIIESVAGGTPAAAAGLQAKDAVIALGGQSLDGPDSLVARIRELRPSSTVTLTVVRSGQTRQVPVTLAPRPQG